MSPLDHSPAGVAYAIKKSGLNQSQVAEQMGVSKSQVSEWVKGTRNITPPNLIALATVLNCPVVVLEAKLDEVSA
jgi:transcriptional regulator with XRE-family HTH domain